MKPVWKYILIYFFALLIVGYLVFSIWKFSGKSNESVCSKLEIVFDENAGKQLITDKEIAEILEKDDLNPIGKTIKNIRTESIEDVLRKNPMIKDAECWRTPSGIVDITIHQRCPKLRVVGWGSYYIDTDRKPMPVSLNYAAYVPVVSGRVTVSMVTGPLFDFVNYIENNPFWDAQIEQINICDDRKIELVPRVGDAIIKLGTLDRYQAKLEKLRKLYRNGFNVIGWNKYKTIDLQYKDQVVCEKEELLKSPSSVVMTEKKDSIIARKL